MIAQNIIKKTQNKAGKALLWAGLGVGLAIGALQVTHYLFPTYKINGISMMPSVSPDEVYGTVTFWDSVQRHDVFMINPDKINELGIKHPEGPYMKRIIGLPGDQLVFSLADGILLSVNGVKTDVSPAPEYSSYKMKSKLAKSKGATIFNHAYHLKMDGTSYPIFRPDSTGFANDEKLLSYTKIVFNFPWLSKQESHNGQVKVTVPEGHYFSLSDNRPAGTDSRHFGFVPESALQQKALLNS